MTVDQGTDAPPADVVRVAICDDSLGFPYLVSAWLESDPRFVRVGLADAGEPLKTLVAAEKPDVVMLDLVLPDVVDSSVLVRELRRLHPRVRVVLVSSLAEDALAAAAASAGVEAYLNKSATAEALCDLLYRVATAP